VHRDRARNLDPVKLRMSAAQVNSKLGPQPQVLNDRRAWRDKRRAAMEHLAALASGDAALLRRAAMIQAGDVDQDARHLLLDTADATDAAEGR
jgi:hypothetical protein